MMPLKAYIEGRPRISRHFRGDMRPDDATGSVYQGSAAHISSPPLCNGGLWKDGRFLRPHRQKRKVGALSTSLRTDHSIYALRGIIRARRRQSGNASAHRKTAEGKVHAVIVNNIRNKTIHRLFAVIRDRVPFDWSYSGKYKRSMTPGD